MCFKASVRELCKWLHVVFQAMYCSEIQCDVGTLLGNCSFRLPSGWMSACMSERVSEWIKERHREEERARERERGGREGERDGEIERERYRGRANKTKTNERKR